MSDLSIAALSALIKEQIATHTNTFSQAKVLAEPVPPLQYFPDMPTSTLCW